MHLVHGNLMRHFILHHDCPMFYETVYINGAYSGLDIEGETRDYAALDVLLTIRDFVTYNRAWTHFYYAFIMLCQAMVLPTPRTAESVAWTMNPLEIELPVPSNWMGWFSELHSGPHLENGDRGTTVTKVVFGPP